MVDFRNTIKSLKIVWVQRLLCESKNSNNKWPNIASEMIGVWNKKLLLHKQDFQDLIFPVWCNTFYRQVLEYWFNFYSKEPEIFQWSLQFVTWDVFSKQ